VLRANQLMILLALPLVLGACTSLPNNATRHDAASVERTIDAFHNAAHRGNFQAYFDAQTLDSVFLGTDATERWTRDEFEAFSRPYFGDGHGWTYRPRDRFVMFNADGTVAWFDELLDNDKLGECRGTGVLELESDGQWRIAHYSLTIPIPNDAVPAAVEAIRASPQHQDGAPDS